MGIDGSDIKRNRQASAKPAAQRKTAPQIDCHACKLESGMEAAEIPRFFWFIRLIGVIIAFPSVLGMVFAAIILISATVGMFGQGGDGGIGIGISIFIFCASAVSGLIGWLLLMKKKVFRCIDCGYILDRA